MATPVILPKFSMTMEEGVILRWLKAEGAAVEKGEPIVEVMTEKVDMEVEAPASGLLVGLRAQPGETVPVTQVIAHILQPGEAPPPTEPRAAPPPPSPARSAPAGAKPVAPPASPAGDPSVAATPVARRLARDAGIELSAVSGTGPGRRITEADVRAALASRTDPSRTPLSARRRIIAQRMLQSAHDIPHVYLTRTVDMSAAAAARGDASYTAVVVWTAARVLSNHPLVRASLENQTVVVHNVIDIGIAVDTPDGLIVPVVRGADGKDLATVHREVEALARRAREGSLRLDEISDGVFTITNLGMFGIDTFTALINPPQSAILAVGAVRLRPWVTDGTLSVRPVCDLTLAVDHRVADGADGARFLDDLRTALEHAPGA